MQVSQMEDTITHAVIGQQESVSMGVSDSAALMHILSSTLYTYPKLAMVREVLCNGWDAHISAGITDKPLKVTISQNSISIQDFGLGIPHNMIGQIYGVYGNSTKRDDSTTTGGFGLGSKAPFAYTDNFEVTSCNEGTKTIYRVSKSSMERGGKPAINKMISIPTTESGIKVTVGIQSKDREEFTDLIHEVLQMGEIKAEVNDVLAEMHYPLEASPTGYIIHNYPCTVGKRVNVRYGNVVYAIPDHVSYHERWANLNHIIGQLGNDMSITFMAPADSISIAPNREAIILTDQTSKTMAELLAMFDDNREFALAKVSTEMVARQMANKVLKERPSETIWEDLRSNRSMCMNDRELLENQFLGYSYTLKRASFQKVLLQRRELVSTSVAQLKRYRQLIANGFIDRKLGKDIEALLVEEMNNERLGKRYKRNHGQTAWTGLLHKYFSKPLLIGLRESEILKRERLYYVSNEHGWNTSHLDTYKNMQIDTPLELVKYFRKEVVIARNKKLAEEFIGTQFQRGSRMGVLFYQVTSKQEHLDAANKLFTDLGFVVHVHIPVKAVEEPELAADGVTVIQADKKVTKVRRKGYITLASSYTDVNDRTADEAIRGTYLLNTARANNEGKTIGVIDPIAYVVLNNKSEGSRKFAGFTPEQCAVINKLYGDRIAVVTTPQSEKLTEEGVLQLRDYVKDHVDKALAARPDFPRYLAFAQYFHEDARYNHQSKFIRYSCNNEKVMENAGLRFHISAETETLLTFFTDDYTNHNTDLVKCMELRGKVKKSPMVEEIKARVKFSHLGDFLKLDYLAGVMKNNATDKPVHPEKMKLAEQLATHLLSKHEANQ